MGNKDGHFDEDRIPSITMFCVGCKVALVGTNIKLEWGLYHGAIGKVLDIVYSQKEGTHAPGDAKDKHPVYTLVDFPQYCGPTCMSRIIHWMTRPRMTEKLGCAFQW